MFSDIEFELASNSKSASEFSSERNFFARKEVSFLKRYFFEVKNCLATRAEGTLP